MVPISGTTSATFGLSGSLVNFSETRYIAGSVAATFGFTGTLVGLLPVQLYTLFEQVYIKRQALLDAVYASGKALADAAQLDAGAALQGISDIASDNVLSAGEKPQVVRDYGVIIAEQGGIDSQATLHGVTTEKNAYGSAITSLTNYLATLTTPKMWNDTTGKTTIVGSVFLQKFKDVYTTRQKLLDAITGKAKDATDAAQDTANTSKLLASQVSVVNPGFDAGDTGWTKESGWSIKNDGSFGFGQGYAEKSGGAANAAIRNTAVCFVELGKSYRVQALVRAIAANGQCYARISWRDLNDNEVGTTNGNLVTGSTVAGSFAVGQAPAGAVFAHAEIAATSHTTGKYQVDNVISTLQPATADEISESTGRKWAGQSGADVIGLNTTFGDNTIINPGGKTGSTEPHFVYAGGTLIAYSHDGTLRTSETPGGSFLYTGTNGVADRVYFNGAHYSPTGGNFAAAAPGETWKASIMLGDWGSGNSGSWRLQLDFRKSDGTFISSKGVTTATASDSDLEYVEVMDKAPAGTGRVGVTLYLYMDGGTNTNVLFQQVSLRKATVSDAGSGVRIGDQRNLTAVTFANYGAGWSGLSLTYTATTTSATISASSATLQSGDVALSYNGSSVSVSGTAGTTMTYTLYYDDPTLQGGSKSLTATTNTITALSSNGRIIVGMAKVVFPSSGTGSGGGGGAGVPCPARTAWVIRFTDDGPEYIRAGEVRAGDRLLLADARWGVVTYSQPRLTQGVRVRGEDGGSLTCSTTAPLGLLGGGSVLAPDSAGQRIRTKRAAGDSDRIVAVQPLGEIWVQHITCEDDFFWTGDNKDCLFSHHNLKPPGDL